LSKTSTASGLLDLSTKGFGFLRSQDKGYQITSDDPYISQAVIKRFRLRPGQEIEVEIGPGARGGRAVKSVIAISGLPPAEAAGLPKFNDLTSISPTERLRMETEGGPVTMRLVDLVTPLGRGARGLIVAPPRTGKTTILKQMAQAMTINQPDLRVIALLVDERPEEVTDMRRSIDGLVVASSMDQEPANHRRVATLMIATARRMVEAGRDVFVILDSVTRLARAFNQAQNSGRTMTGGLDAKAMEVPRQIFGSARATEEAGSLTIVATALVDTGSRMDELIFQEFKGTGNMELSLSREMADRRVWPAINIAESGTRKEELLFDDLERDTVPLIRRALLKLRPEQATEKMAQTLGKHPDNKSFLTLVKEGEF